MRSTGTASAVAVALVVTLAGGAAGALSGDAPRRATLPATSPSAAAPTPSPSASSTATELAELATVKLTLPCTEGDCAYGSGSVVDSTGLILTNAHVVAPAAPGLAEQYDELREDVEDPPYVLVSVVPSPEADAVLRYRAEVRAVDGYADLAVVEVVAEADGSPLAAPVRLANISLGSLASTRKDADIRVVGFPETGSSDSPTVQRGTVASKPTDPAGRVRGAWELNTGAPIHSGNSGGLVVDAQGRLIAVPTYSRGVREQTYRARAVELARPLLDAAKADRAYTSPALVPLTDDEELLDAVWSFTPFDDECAEPGTPLGEERSDELHVQVRLAGLVTDEHFRLVVTGPDGEQTASLAGEWTALSCLVAPVTYLSGGGTYTVTAYAGPSPTPIGLREVIVPDGLDG